MTAPAPHRATTLPSRFTHSLLTVRFAPHSHIRWSRFARPPATHGSLDSRLRRSSSRTPFSRPRYAPRSLFEDSLRSSSHRSLVHPSHGFCSWPSLRSDTLASARQGGGREQRGAKRLGSERYGRERAPSRDPGKGWQMTSLRTHFLHPTYPTTKHTRKRPGERLANDSPSASLSKTHSINWQTITTPHSSSVTTHDL